MYVVEAERARGSKRSTLQSQIKAKVLKSHCIGHVSLLPCSKDPCSKDPAAPDQGKSSQKSLSYGSLLHGSLLHGTT